MQLTWWEYFGVQIPILTRTHFEVFNFFFLYLIRANISKIFIFSAGDGTKWWFSHFCVQLTMCARILSRSKQFHSILGTTITTELKNNRNRDENECATMVLNKKNNAHVRWKWMRNVKSFPWHPMWLAVTVWLFWIYFPWKW